MRPAPRNPVRSCRSRVAWRWLSSRRSTSGLACDDPAGADSCRQSHWAAARSLVAARVSPRSDAAEGLVDRLLGRVDDRPRCERLVLDLERERVLERLLDVVVARHETRAGFCECAR